MFTEFIIFSCLSVLLFPPALLVCAADVAGQNAQAHDTRDIHCDCGKLRNDIDALSHKVSSMSFVLKSKMKASHETEDRILALEGELKSVQQELRRKAVGYESELRAIAYNISSFDSRLGSNFAVGFTARFSYNPVTNVAPGGTYVFNDVVSNVGNAYNPQTGIFTAPVSGLYSFHFKFMSTNDHMDNALSIVRNGVNLGFAWANGSSDMDDQSSTMVVTLMEKGQQAWVSHFYGPTVVRGEYWTEFTGFLVQAQ